MTHWVCKADGRIQCQDDPEIPLAVMRLELASIIGAANILSEKKVSIPTIQLCGMPEGTRNAYEITDDGHYLLFHGFTGPNGFRDCPGDKAADGREIAEPDFATGVALSSITSAVQSPVLVRELIGHRVRVYEQGSPITMDYVPSRVNIVTKNHVIVDVWFG